MKCPRCKLINPDAAERCDCGYDFETKKVEQSFLPPKLHKQVPNLVGPDKWKRWLRMLSCLVILFGGTIFADWVVANIFSLPSEAATQLTEMSLRGTLAVCAAIIFFRRGWLTLKTSLITVAALSVGIFLFVAISVLPSLR
jgi:hypothetical protein